MLDETGWIHGAEDRIANEDWQARLIQDLCKSHPHRMRRVLKDLAWLRNEARKTGHRLAGDETPWGDETP